MNRLPAALAAVIAATVSVAGCANAGALAGHGKKLPRMPAPLPGKYQALAVSFPGRDAGIALISGYPGKSATLRSWIDRTADGGNSWVASGPASGQHQPGAQAGMAFVSAGQGWAYLPGLFFTRDGGVTCRAERTRFPLTGPVAVAGTSTWVVGYACVRGVCPATIYAMSRVGGALRRLADQPTATGTLEVMQRPTESVVWLLLTGPGPTPGSVSGLPGTSALLHLARPARTWSGRSPASSQASPRADREHIFPRYSRSGSSDDNSALSRHGAAGQEEYRPCTCLPWPITRARGLRKSDSC